MIHIKFHLIFVGIGMENQYNSNIFFYNSQVHNFQKLRNISLKAVNFLATNTKVTCLSESVFFHLHISELLLFSRPCG